MTHKARFAQARENPIILPSFPGSAPQRRPITNIVSFSPRGGAPGEGSIITVSGLVPLGSKRAPSR